MKLGEVSEWLMVPLIAALNDEYPGVNDAAAKALGKVGAPALKPLIVALKHKNYAVREGAAEALGKIGNIGAVEPLTAIIDDEYTSVGRAAARGLKRIVENNAASIAPDSLYMLANLQDVIRVRWAESNCANEPDEELHSTVDCLQVRQLARQELIRCGLEA